MLKFIHPIVDWSFSSENVLFIAQVLSGIICARFNMCSIITNRRRLYASTPSLFLSDKHHDLMSVNNLLRVFDDQIHVRWRKFFVHNNRWQVENLEHVVTWNEVASNEQNWCFLMTGKMHFRFVFSTMDYKFFPFPLLLLFLHLLDNLSKKKKKIPSRCSISFIRGRRKKTNDYGNSW